MTFEGFGQKYTSKEANRRNDVLSHQLECVSLICSGAKLSEICWNAVWIDSFWSIEYLTRFMSYLWDEINFDESQH